MPMPDLSVPSEADFYDPRAGGQTVRAQDLYLQRGPHEPARTNYFAVYRIDSGSGTIAADYMLPDLYIDLVRAL